MFKVWEIEKPYQRDRYHRTMLTIHTILRTRRTHLHGTYAVFQGLEPPGPLRTSLAGQTLKQTCQHYTSYQEYLLYTTLFISRSIVITRH